MKLISFSVSNYKSFYKEQVIEFNTDKKNANVVLGPNGAGKSNLFDAMLFVRDFARNSTNFQGQQMQYAPFLYNEKGMNDPTSFKIEAKLGKSKYSYSFSILNTKITAEKLQIDKETIFSRDSIRNGKYEKYDFDNELLKKTSDQALVLTKAWEDQNKYAKKTFKIFEQLKFLRGNVNPVETAERILNDEKFKVKVLDFLQRADLSIQNVSVVKTKMPDDIYNNLPIKDELKKGMDRTGYNIFTTHIVRGENGNATGVRQVPVQFESTGTRRIFELVLPLIDSLDNGYTVYIDDFEVFLHPDECKFIVNLFGSEENKTGAKLIVNTHDRSLIDQVSRDNVYLFGKDPREETFITKIKGVRADDTAIEKKYNAGILGSTPNIRW